MKKLIGTVVSVVALLSIAVAAEPQWKKLREVLTGYEETPLAISTPAIGEFKATLSRETQEIQYELSYTNLTGDVTQAHIHVGSSAQTGGIAAFLCTNLGNGPAGTQACPAAPATITGTIVASDIIGPSAQGIAAGEFQELLDAIQAGVAYVNVHSTTFPIGEIRAQFRQR